VFRTLAETFDWVILDCSPVLPVTDALVAARCADAVLMVASQGSSSRRAFQRAVEMLRQIDAPLLGFVLNRGTDEVRAYGGVYETERPKERRKRRTRATKTETMASPPLLREPTFDSYEDARGRARLILEQAERRLDAIVSSERDEQPHATDIADSARWFEPSDKLASEALAVQEREERGTSVNNCAINGGSDSPEARNGAHAKDLFE
jgi:hypothetical protein